MAKPMVTFSSEYLKGPVIELVQVDSGQVKKVKLILDPILNYDAQKQLETFKEMMLSLGCTVSAESV